MITKHNPILHGESILRHLVPAVAGAALMLSGCASQPAQPTSGQTSASATQSAPSQNAQHQESKTDADQTKPQTMPAEHTQAPVVRDDAPLEYTVKKGDTLWDIAGYYLKDPWLWPQIWHVNQQIKNPHLIYPGDILHLVRGENDHYQVRLQPGEKRLQPQVQREPLTSAISTIPIGAIKPFLNSPRVVSKNKLDNSGYIVAFPDKRILAAKGDTAYATGLGNNPRTEYEAVHPGPAYKDPVTGNVLGYKATPTARVKVTQAPKNGSAAVLELTQIFQETSVGDRLLPVDKSTLRAGYTPHAPKDSVHGFIIAAFHSVKEIGRYKIVALNVGTSDGVDAGTVLDVYRPGRDVPDPYHKHHGDTVRIPKAKSGDLMVFKSDKHLSHAIIMNATQEIHVGNVVENPSP